MVVVQQDVDGAVAQTLEVTDGALLGAHDGVGFVDDVQPLGLVVGDPDVRGCVRRSDRHIPFGKGE